MRISDWSSDVGSSDLSRPGSDIHPPAGRAFTADDEGRHARDDGAERSADHGDRDEYPDESFHASLLTTSVREVRGPWNGVKLVGGCRPGAAACEAPSRSEEHTSELQSLMRISYAVFCLKKK